MMFVEMSGQIRYTEFRTQELISKGLIIHTRFTA